MSPVWSAADVATATRLPEGGVLLVLQCFFDDSGTHGGSKCAVWGGVAGRVEQFAYLEAKWAEILKNRPHNKPPIKKFGMADCRGQFDEFVGYNDGESDHLVYCLRNIIIESGVIPLAWGTDAQSWRTHFSGALGKLFGSPECASFGYCSKVALKAAEEHDELISLFSTKAVKALFSKCSMRVPVKLFQKEQSARRKASCLSKDSPGSKPPT